MSTINTDPKKIEKILTRGVIAKVIPSAASLRKALCAGKQLRIYLGIDPTAADLHLGHAQNIMLLEEFRALGHRAILLVGDFTAQIGDPSDRAGTRPRLSKELVKQNVAAIVKQVRPLLNTEDPLNPARIEYNSSWLSNLSMEDFLTIAAHFTLQQMSERDMFKQRMEAGSPVYLNEFLYPLMQGYDSVALDTDVELGGTDQTFNMLAGRTLLKRMKNKEKFVVSTRLIQNQKTGVLMSKSAGTGVFIGAAPAALFGQVMAQPDEMVEVLFVSNTRVPLKEIKKLVQKTGPGAKEAKLRLAEEIVGRIHGHKAAQRARGEFERVFAGGKAPQEMTKKSLPYKTAPLLQIVADSGLASSRAEARRLIECGAVEIDGKVRRGPGEDIAIGRGVTLRVGKRQFARIRTA